MKKRVLICLVAALLVLSPMIPSAKAANLAVERRIFDFVTQELGLNSAAACGILANIEAESNFNLTCIGDKGTSFGLCQWHNSRYDDLKTYCLHWGYDYRSLEGQMNYMAYELRTTYRGVLSVLKNVPDTADGAYTAAYHWCYYYERPADLEGASLRRGRNAQFKYWLRYGGTVVPGTPNTFTSGGYSGALYDDIEDHSFYWDEYEQTDEPIAGTTILPPMTQEPENDHTPNIPETPGQNDGVGSGGNSGTRFHYTPHHLPKPVQTVTVSAGLAPVSCLFVAAGPMRKAKPVPEGRGVALPEDWDGEVADDELSDDDVQTEVACEA